MKNIKSTLFFSTEFEVEFKFHNIVLLLVAISIGSCGMKDKIEQHEKAKINSDFIMENFNDVAIVNQFPEKFFPRKQFNLFWSRLTKNCDFNAKQGKYVDFFSMLEDGKNKTAFIYEYTFKCDSIRFIYMYDMSEKEPVLYKLRLEPLEKPSNMIIDPKKQLLYGK